MVSQVIIGLFGAMCFVALAQAYSGGAPVDVCEDMLPKHPVAPQKTKMPYQVNVNSATVANGGVVKITISGKSGFKGLMVQVRQGKEVVGKFLVSDSDKYVKTIDCDGKQNTATHKNSEEKNNLTLQWQADGKIAGKVQVYVTVAEDGGTFWVRQPTATITVN